VSLRELVDDYVRKQLAARDHQTGLRQQDLILDAAELRAAIDGLRELLAALEELGSKP
jgi:hypothetical protein